MFRDIVFKWLFLKYERIVNYMEKNKEAKEVDLGTGSVGKLLFQLALPAITAQIINVLYNMVDRMYIGHLPGEGAHALTGVGVTSRLSWRFPPLLPW